MKFHNIVTKKGKLKKLIFSRKLMWKIDIIDVENPSDLPILKKVCKPRLPSTLKNPSPSTPPPKNVSSILNSKSYIGDITKQIKGYQEIE